MIYVKNNEEIEKMRKAGKIVADLLEYLADNLRAGMQTGHVLKQRVNRMPSAAS